MRLPAAIVPATNAMAITPGDPLVATAVAIGRRPGEPGHVLLPFARPSILGWLFGIRPRAPLADPQLEVIRAISASLARGARHIDGRLMAAAAMAGVDRAALDATFPDAAAPGQDRSAFSG